MGKRRRWGIRAKLLAFYAVVLLAAATLDLFVQIATFGAVNEFESRLSRYHAVHRFKLAFDDQYTRVERQLREGTWPELETLGQEYLNLWLRYKEISTSEPENRNAYFNAQAIGYGLDIYTKYLSTAVKQRAAGEKDWYQEVASAGRIVGYVDGYLSTLLSEALNTGEDRFRLIVRGAVTVRNVSILALAGLALALGAFAWAFSASVAKPITILAAASERMAAGDLAVSEVRASTGDEVETLTRSFNAMSKSIRGMVEDLRDKAELERRLREEERQLMEKERSLRDAQFQSLQDQIRPHFLFNALNTIARTALFENAAETERLTLALGKLLHYSFGPASSLIAIKEEVSILSEYLSFQALRFGERLKWEIAVDKKAEAILIPRFTLQPLVENAVRHGIEPMENGGGVTVRISRRNGRVTLMVQDTGIGMDAEKIQALLAGGKEAGIGIANVLGRLKLRYSGLERVSIRSAIGTGTTFRLSFPIENIGTEAPV